MDFPDIPYSLNSLSAPSASADSEGCRFLATRSLAQSGGNPVTSSTHLPASTCSRAGASGHYWVRMGRPTARRGIGRTRAGRHERFDCFGPSVASCTARDRILQFAGVAGIARGWSEECLGFPVPFERPT